MPRVMPWLNFGRGNKELFGRTLGSGLGWSVGAAIGIKMAKPDRQTVCLIGDGAFLMGQIEALWAARRFEAPVLYIVFNNRSFNDTRMRVIAMAPRLRETRYRHLSRQPRCQLRAGGESLRRQRRDRDQAWPDRRR